MERQEVVKVAVTGLVLGITAAVIVWWLERFEVNQFHAEVKGYLSNYDRFQLWLKDHPDAA